MSNTRKSTFGDCGPVEAVYKNGEVTMRMSKCAKRRKNKYGSAPKKSQASARSRSHSGSGPSKQSGEWDMKTQGTKGLGRVYNVKRTTKGKCHCAVAFDKAGFIIGFKCAPISKPKLLITMRGSHPEAHKIRVKKCYTPYGVAS